MKKHLFVFAILTLFVPTLVHAETRTGAEEKQPHTQVLAANEESTLSSEQTEAEQAEESTISTQTSESTSPSASTESSTETENNEAEAAKKTEEKKDEVIKNVEDKIGKAKDPVPEENISDADKIRQTLKEGSYGISEAELKNYSDEQLMNTLTLFKRYNQDLYGLDMGAFVKILNALYKDHTLSWDKISPQLSFVPADFTSFAAMENQVDALSTYLKTLYPSNSSFFPIQNLSKQELLTILKKLQTIEEKIKKDGAELDLGRIAWISNEAEKLDTTEETETSEQAKDSGGEAGKSTDSAKNTADSAEKKGKNFPQTGEQGNSWMMIVGILLIVIVIGIIWFTKKKNKK